MVDNEPELTVIPEDHVNQEIKVEEQCTCLSKSLDFSIKFDLDKAISTYGREVTWDETAKNTLSDFLHHFLIFVLVNRGESQKKVFTLKEGSSEGDAITNYMKEHGPPEPTERTKLENSETYTSSDFFQEITTENFTDDLPKFAFAESIKALYKFSNFVDQVTVTPQMIHLSFDFEQVKQFILKYFDFHYESFAVNPNLTCMCAGVASMLEYVSAEIIEISSSFAEEKVLTTSSLKKGLQSDPALLSLPCTHLIINETP